MLIYAVSKGWDGLDQSAFRPIGWNPGSGPRGSRGRRENYSARENLIAAQAPSFRLLLCWTWSTSLDEWLLSSQRTARVITTRHPTIMDFLADFIKAQKIKGPQMKDAPTFYRNLEEALDLRRSDHGMFTNGLKSPWKSGKAVDFCSNDLLSLGKTGLLRKEFLNELGRNPDFPIYAGGSRLVDGNYDYIEQVEQEIAAFHGAEMSLIVGSGFEANNAIYSAIPRPGDAIVYDELVHASVHDGMTHSLALTKVAFRHNDVDALRDALVELVDSQPLIKDGSRTVLISVESVYSMDGDVCPLREMLEISREVCPRKNFAFIVDEAHATGIIGPKGVGLVSLLGLEKEIAIRLHTYGKALASTGGNMSQFVFRFCIWA